ncbi:MAG TPA: sensor histidine kinase [Pseudonocardiaceae bacterium]|jgi:signal transduction histidine kinase
MSPAAKRDALLLPAVFIINCFIFSPWLRILSDPWLMIVWLYGIAILIPLIWRDKAPVAIFTAQCVLAIVAWPFIDLYSPVSAFPLALYAVAVHRNKKESLLALLASVIPIGICASVAFRVFDTLSVQLQSFIPNVILLSIVTAGAWGAGRVTRASQQHVQQLERERETVREAVAAERSRIARELHDIVSHAVTAIVLQAAGAARVAKTNFAQVTQSLQHIETTGKQAMAELRRLLGVLEANDSNGRPAGRGELGPQPGLADMALLLTSLKDTGMPVTVHVEGTPRNLDPSIDLAAYRIVQEGLTNVLKHAGTDSHPQLRMVWKADSLLIQIDNDLNQAQARHGQALSVGRGLVGLRARAQAAGGRLHSGLHHNGGYRLSATLPFADTAQRALSDANVARASTGEHGNNGKVSA